MNDRLAELKVNNASEMDDVDLCSVAIDVTPTFSANKSCTKLFFEDVERIKEDIKFIDSACKKLDDLTEEALLSPVDMAGVNAKDKINAIIGQTIKRVKHAKALLYELRQQTDALKNDPSSCSDTDIRVRDNLLQTFTRKFIQCTKEYQGKQSIYKLQMKSTAERAVKAVKPGISEDEMEAVFKQENGVIRVLEAAVMKDRGDPVEVANVLAHLQDTYKDVQRLEAGILELHQMFMDLSVLVEQQGETLDVIEVQVSNAKEFVKKGNENLKKAIEISKTVRKRRWCVIFMVLSLVALVFIFVIVL